MKLLRLIPFVFALVFHAFAAEAAAPAKMVNMSALVTGNNTIGFVISGESPKNLLVRAVGPSLRSFGVENAATQTTLRIFSGPREIAVNASGWGANLNVVEIIAVPGPFPLPQGSRDSALLLSFSPGNYTAQITANGAVLLEIYEAL